MGEKDGDPESDSYTATASSQEDRIHKVHTKEAAPTPEPHEIQQAINSEEGTKSGGHAGRRSTTR